MLLTWQPTLVGSLLHLRPLRSEDFDPLYAAASDPSIWSQHPEKDRYKLENFADYFRSGMDSDGALVISDRKNNQIIGSSRFFDYDEKQSWVEIGYTFLTRDYWGGGYNKELKNLMLKHAFLTVETAYIVIGKENLRSRKAATKIGAVEVVKAPVQGDLRSFAVYEIKKDNWMQISLQKTVAE